MRKSSGPSHVLVRGNRIEKISGTPITAERGDDTLVVDGGGRTPMPGLIDVHWHVMMVWPMPAAVMTDDVGYTNLVAGAEATDTLMRGFTTVRDMGGPAFKQYVTEPSNNKKKKKNASSAQRSRASRMYSLLYAVAGGPSVTRLAPVA